jgi:hypothetical protein
VWGKCNHSFHMHCILKWVGSKDHSEQLCPMCRRWVLCVLTRLSHNCHQSLGVSLTTRPRTRGLHDASRLIGCVCASECIKVGITKVVECDEPASARARERRGSSFRFRCATHSLPPIMPAILTNALALSLSSFHEIHQAIQRMGFQYRLLQMHQAQKEASTLVVLTHARRPCSLRVRIAASCCGGGFNHGHTSAAFTTYTRSYCAWQPRGTAPDFKPKLMLIISQHAQHSTEKDAHPTQASEF